MSGCYYINTRCWISAHDVETGEELWRTHTIPVQGEPGSETWGALPDEQRRGGSAWIAPSYDPELNLIYVGVAVPIPWGSVQRDTGDGDVLYTNSTLALNADSGEIEWYFQHLPGDEWDLDHPVERILVETEVAPDPDAVAWLNPDITPGRRKVVTGVPGKPGLVWTLDAVTGDFLWAKETSYQNVIVGVDVEGRKGIANPDIKAFGDRGGDARLSVPERGRDQLAGGRLQPPDESALRAHQQHVYDLRAKSGGAHARRVPQLSDLRAGAGAELRWASGSVHGGGRGDGADALGASAKGRDRGIGAEHGRRVDFRHRRRPPFPGL